MSGQQSGQQIPCPGLKDRTTIFSSRFFSVCFSDSFSQFMLFRIASWPPSHTTHRRRFHFLDGYWSLFCSTWWRRPNWPTQSETEKYCESLSHRHTRSWRDLGFLQSYAVIVVRTHQIAPNQTIQVTSLPADSPSETPRYATVTSRKRSLPLPNLSARCHDATEPTAA